GGAILLQQPIVINEDDTAFTLGVKCAETGARSFERLVALLMAEARGDAPLHAAPQGAREQFHFKSDRPGLGIIDLRQSTAQIQNFVRALDFGADDNWMCRAKLSLPGGLFLVEQVDVVPGAGDPGTVLAFDRDAISIAVADGVLRFSPLATPDGDPVPAAMTGVRVGQVLAMTD